MSKTGSELSWLLSKMLRPQPSWIKKHRFKLRITVRRMVPFPAIDRWIDDISRYNTVRYGGDPEHFRAFRNDDHDGPIKKPSAGGGLFSNV